MYVPSVFFLEKLMTQLIDHAIAGPFSGILDGVYLGLGQFPSRAVPPTATLSAITEANYGGYARLPLTWKGPYLKGVSDVTIQSDLAYFVPTDSTASNQITTFFVADALTAGNLLLSDLLPNGPTFLSNPQTAFSLSLVFQMLSANNLGSAVQI